MGRQGKPHLRIQPGRFSKGPHVDESDSRLSRLCSRLPRTRQPDAAMVVQRMDVSERVSQTPVLRAPTEGGPMICALLLGREGSIAFPGKNLHPLLGRPLVAYPLMAARQAKSVD